MNKIRIRVNVAVDRSPEQLVFDPRIDLQHLRVVLQHLIEIIFCIELAHTLHAQRAPHHQLLSSIRISSKITHGNLPPVDFCSNVQRFKVSGRFESKTQHRVRRNAAETLNFKPGTLNRAYARPHASKNLRASSTTGSVTG